MGKWDDLSLNDKHELMKIFMDGGITDIRHMRGYYNSFADGGEKRGLFGWLRKKKEVAVPDLPEWDQDFVDNLVQEDTNSSLYSLRKSVAENDYKSRGASERYNYRMGIYDTQAKDFLKGMYSSRKSLFPNIDLNKINKDLDQPYSISNMPESWGGYYNERDGVNYNQANHVTLNTYMGGTPVHERTHSLQLADQENSIQNEIDRSYEVDDEGKSRYGFLREGVEYDPYLDDPREIYARRNAFLQYLSQYGNTYYGEAKDGRSIEDFTPDMGRPFDGRWLEALKSNGNVDDIDTFMHSPEMYEDEYWNGEQGTTFYNNFLSRYSPEFILFLLNGIAQNTSTRNLPPNQNIAAYGMELNTDYTPSEDIKNYLKRTEGFVDHWYEDGNGVPTIGYGFTGKYFRDKYPNGMTREQADREFDRVVDKFAGYVKTYTPNYDSLKQNQKDALLSYMYNVGPGNYQTRHPEFIEALRNKDYDTAAEYMNIGYNDSRNPGLRKRRDYERSLFLGNSDGYIGSQDDTPQRAKYVQTPQQDTQNDEEAYKDLWFASLGVSPEVRNAAAVGSIEYRQEEQLFNDTTPLSSFSYSGEYSNPYHIQRAPEERPQPQESSSSYAIPSNEDILEQLFSNINAQQDYDYTGNLFVKGGPTEEERQQAIASVLANRGNVNVAPVSFDDNQFKAQRDAVQVRHSPAVEQAMETQTPAQFKQLTDEAYFTEGKLLGETDKAMIRKRMSQLKTPEQVKEFQKTLVEHGYDIGKSGADGKFGKKTRAAAQQYFNDIISSRQEMQDESALQPTSQNMFTSAPPRVMATIAPVLALSGLASSRTKEAEKENTEAENPLAGLSDEDIVSLYTGANKHAGRSSAYTLLNHLIPGTKKARMDRATRDQLAILLAKYGDRVNTVDSFDELGEYGSKERTSKLSPIGYKHENALAGEEGKGVNESSTDGNALRTVLGMFGAVKDKDGNFLINDDYDNEVFRIDKETLDANPEAKKQLQSMRVGKKKQKVLSTNDKEKNTYLVTREGFDVLRENGLLDGPRTTLLKDLYRDIVKSKTPYEDMELNDRLRRYGENAIVRTGKATRFDFTMSNKEIARRVNRVRRKLGK